MLLRSLGVLSSVLVGFFYAAVLDQAEEFVATLLYQGF